MVKITNDEAYKRINQEEFKLVMSGINTFNIKSLELINEELESIITTRKQINRINRFFKQNE